MPSQPRTSLRDCPATQSGEIIAHGWLATWISYCNATWGSLRSAVINNEAAMSEDWNTKYGTRRVRRDPPTLDEAIFAAVGITDNVEAQAEIAASLMGMPIEQVQAEVKKAARPTLGRSTTHVIAGE